MRFYVLNDSSLYKARNIFPASSRNRLTNWDFKDEKLNGTIQQINRQKSALHQTIVFWDAEQKIAAFEESHDGLNTTTLDSCTCRDFNLAGNHPRKKFSPCKHIYCLCFEMGILEPKHFDHRMRLQMMPKLTWEERLLEVLKKLQSYPRDESQWGSWSAEVHKDHYQIRRQLRAFGIIQENPIEVVNSDKGRVGDYETNLTRCTCFDFMERLVPCKHIYCLAILKGYPLAATLEDYVEQKNDLIDKVALAVERRYAS